MHNYNKTGLEKDKAFAYNSILSTMACNKDSHGALHAMDKRVTVLYVIH
jgi:hypothetical protein